MSKPLFYDFYSGATPYWSRGDHRVYALAALIGVNLAIIVQLNREQFSGPFYLALLVGVFGFALSSYIGQKIATPKIAKWVALDLVDTHQLIAHVLQTKGLPFQDKGLRFLVEGTDLTIRLEKGYLYRSWEKGTIITLIPLHPDNLPLSDSLRQQIDTALKPRGLTP